MKQNWDIAIVWDNATGHGEWQVQDNDLLLDNGLHSAVMVSLFTDRLAPLEPDGDEVRSGIGRIDGDRRGWWGDMFLEESMGSRLWQLKRAVRADRDSLVSAARNMIDEALQWMLRDGLVTMVRVDVHWAGRGILEFAIELIEPARNTPQVFLYRWAWEGA